MSDPIREQHQISDVVSHAGVAVVSRELKLFFVGRPEPIRFRGRQGFLATQPERLGDETVDVLVDVELSGGQDLREKAWAGSDP